jgi:acetyl-CoA carboxylase biotin carboxyl carrier protein
VKKGSVDPDLVRELAKLLDETGLTEIEVADGPGRIRVARNLTLAAAPAVAAAPSAAAPAQANGGPAALPAGTVTSPMVGTAYLAPEPDKPPFVRVGDAVSKGQTLVIVEAMKTMNPIPSPRDGKVTRILVQNAQPIEFGQPLLVIE